MTVTTHGIPRVSNRFRILDITALSADKREESRLAACLRTRWTMESRGFSFGMTRIREITNNRYLYFGRTDRLAKALRGEVAEKLHREDDAFRHRGNSHHAARTACDRGFVFLSLFFFQEQDNNTGSSVSCSRAVIVPSIFFFSTR